MGLVIREELWSLKHCAAREPAPSRQKTVRPAPASRTAARSCSSPRSAEPDPATAARANCRTRQRRHRTGTVSPPRGRHSKWNDRFQETVPTRRLTTWSCVALRTRGSTCPWTWASQWPSGQRHYPLSPRGRRASAAFTRTALFFVTMHITGLQYNELSTPGGLTASAPRGRRRLPCARTALHTGGVTARKARVPPSRRT